MRKNETKKIKELSKDGAPKTLLNDKVPAGALPKDWEVKHEAMIQKRDSLYRRKQHKYNIVLRKRAQKQKGKVYYSDRNNNRNAVISILRNQGFELVCLELGDLNYLIINGGYLKPNKGDYNMPFSVYVEKGLKQDVKALFPAKFRRLIHLENTLAIIAEEVALKRPAKIFMVIGLHSNPEAELFLQWGIRFKLEELFSNI